MYKGKSKCFDSVLMVREGNICTVQLTNEILSYGGRYVFQLRGYTDTQTYHSDIFESWVNTSIEYQYDCKQGDCECDCKLPTEFYQVEDNVTEINNHPPYPGDNNKWMIWDVDKHEYVESDIEVIAGGEDYQTKANLTTSITAESTDEQYPSAKATQEDGQSIAESAGKIDAITVNGTTQTVEDKTAKIIVNKSTVGLGNVNNTSDNDKPVSFAQASAIADAKQAGTTAQANLDAHIDNKENPHDVTKAQVGLSDVDNTSDENKPVSMLQAIAIADAKKAGTDAQANLTAHINNKENPHEVTKAQVGLGNVNNTSDANKPISTATQNALNEKLAKTAVVDVTVEALTGQAADAKSVYDAIQAVKPDIVAVAAEARDIAQSVRDDADAGLFKGEEGKPGLTPHIGENGNWFYGDEDSGIPAGAAGIKTDHTLSYTNGVLSVNTANAPEADNTLPITSAAVNTVVGNIETLLNKI